MFSQPALCLFISNINLTGTLLLFINHYYTFNLSIPTKINFNNTITLLNNRNVNSGRINESK